MANTTRFSYNQFSDNIVANFKACPFLCFFSFFDLLPQQLITAFLDLLPQLQVARHGVHDDRLGVLRTSSGASTVVCAWFCITTEATHVEDRERGERKVMTLSKL